MGAAQVIVEGTLRPDGILEVPQGLPLPPGRVRLTIEAIPEPSANRAGLGEFFERIRREQASSGFVARSKEEIDATVGALRDEWEGRLDGIERLQDECRRARRDPGC